MLPRLKVQDVKVILKHEVAGAKWRARRGGAMQATDARQRGFAL